MTIGWYPGHMVAARRKAVETLARTDVVVEVLDARLPGASRNPMIEDLRRHRQRPCIRVLNKADLADPEATAQWVRAIAEDTAPGDRVQALPLCAHRPADIARLPRLAQSLAPHRDSALKPLRLMVMGIPNVGKSTLINALARRRIAEVGDEPAVTKREQRIDVNDRLVLFDTPGLMWPLIEHASDGLMLAASHAIGVNAYIDEEVAQFLAEVLLARYRPRLVQRYAIGQAVIDGPAVIEAVAVRRGLLLRGGVPDPGKAARALLADYRSGALGRISLETPDTRAAMLATDRAADPSPPAPSPDGPLPSDP
ncbi:MAG: ribosome biogenesis GTPase YlqF [Pseudomonadota bacterium]|jgi:ribosome biogenesis GTPase A